MALAVTVPHTFINGTTADADEVNENFAVIAAALETSSLMKDRFVFVTDTTTPGNFGGFAYGDALCQAEADAAGLPGEFKVWLSNSTKDAIDHHFPGRAFYRRPGGDGATIAFGFDRFSSGNIANAINLKADGTTGGSKVWTGTRVDGTLDPGLACNDWGTTGAASGRTGSLSQTSTWTFGSVQNCSTWYSLYCIQQ